MATMISKYPDNATEITGRQCNMTSSGIPLPSTPRKYQATITMTPMSQNRKESERWQHP